MGASFNHVTLLGNLVRAPELRYTPQGTAVCDLSIAINRTYTETDGTKKEEVTYVDIVCWSKFAEIAGKYLKKGSQVLISGRLHQDSWIDKNTGQKRSKIVVIAENLQMLGSRADNFFSDGGRELFDCAGQGRVDVFFLSGGQIDGQANINLVSVGDYEKPVARFPGSFGSAYLYYVVPKVILFRVEHSRRTLVPSAGFRLLF